MKSALTLLAFLPLICGDVSAQSSVDMTEAVTGAVDGRLVNRIVSLGIEAAASGKPCQLFDPQKVKIASEACFVVEHTDDVSTKQACSRLEFAVSAEYDCKARNAVNEAIGDR